jgi:hypothetical protein
MRKFLIIALVTFLACSAFAQTAHQATLTWAAGSDASATTTYNAYRAPAACPATGLGTLTFTKINAAPITGGNAPGVSDTYIDKGLAEGIYCYYVTAQDSVTLAESLPSNTAGGVIRPNTVTIQIVLQ